MSRFPRLTEYGVVATLGLDLHVNGCQRDSLCLSDVGDVPAREFFL